MYLKKNCLLVNINNVVKTNYYGLLQLRSQGYVYEGHTIYMGGQQINCTKIVLEHTHTYIYIYYRWAYWGGQKGACLRPWNRLRCSKFDFFVVWGNILFFILLWLYYIGNNNKYMSYIYCLTKIHFKMHQIAYFLNIFRESMPP